MPKYAYKMFKTVQPIDHLIVHNVDPTCTLMVSSVHMQVNILLHLLLLETTPPAAGTHVVMPPGKKLHNVQLTWVKQ